jgi:hypothetical protein
MQEAMSFVQLFVGEIIIPNVRTYPINVNAVAMKDVLNVSK